MPDWKTLLAPACRERGLTLREEDPAADAGFIDRLYTSTRTDELAKTGWSEHEIHRFLQRQSRLQQAHYREHYPEAEYLVMTAAGEPVGRLYLDTLDAQLRLMDIAFLPDWRGGGRGTALILKLQELAAERDLAVTLHVEPFNPACRLYERLGFRTMEVRGVYHFMRWAHTE